MVGTRCRASVTFAEQDILRAVSASSRASLPQGAEHAKGEGVGIGFFAGLASLAPLREHPVLRCRSFASARLTLHDEAIAKIAE